MYGSVGASGAEGGERREGGKRGRRPGRKAQLDKQDMKAKLGKDLEYSFGIMKSYDCLVD